MRVNRELLRELWELETGTDAGRVNYQSSLLLFALVWVLTAFSSVVEMVVRIFDRDYTAGIPYLQLVIVFAVCNALCVLLLAVLRGYLRNR